MKREEELVEAIRTAKCLLDMSEVFKDPDVSRATYILVSALTEEELIGFVVPEVKA